MRLPVLVSVPHAGRRVPPEVADLCLLSEAQIVADGDEGADAIYDFADAVAEHVRAEVGRAVVDPNRAPDDRRPDGVVKTRTVFGEAVYREPLSEATIETLLRRYYHPYHRRLSGPRGPVLLGVDCHTMLAVGPDAGPGAGAARPEICLSNADGTCSPDWLASLAECLEAAFGLPVSRNDPFTGGYIIRAHAGERPWVQLELSRAPFASVAEKRRAVLTALGEFCARHGERGPA